MISSPEPDAQEAVRKVIHDINAAWINGHPENIAGRLHEHVVMIQPGFRGRAAGREASVNSYRDFCDQATIHDFKQSDPEIDVFGSTAVATYRFEITYEIGGKTLHEAGRDVFVLVREVDQWKTVWRTIIPLSGEA